MVALILGDSGQDGFYLKSALNTLGIHVLELPRRKDGFKYSIDIASFSEVSSVVKKFQPDLIFHLAAKSSVDHTFILQNHSAIVQGTLNVFESVFRFSRNTRVFIASSGLAFAESDLPVSETSDFSSSNSYSLCRIESIYIARYYRTLGIHAYIGYLFNHESEMRPFDCLSRTIARQALRVSLGLSEHLSIRNPWVVREWMHAEDAVNAMITLTTQSAVLEACIGDGVGRSIYEYAGECCRAVGIELDRYLVVDDSYVPNFTYLVSDPALIKRLGWKPNVSFEHLVRSIVTVERSLIQLG